MAYLIHKYKDRQCACKHDNDAPLRNNCSRAKATLFNILSVSVALVTQQGKRMRLIISSSLTCLDLPYFSTLSHKQHDFRTKSH
jgi:hypothetical protein